MRASPSSRCSADMEPSRVCVDGRMQMDLAEGAPSDCSASLAPSCRHGRAGRASAMRQSVGLQHPHTAALRAWQPAGSRRPLSQAPGPREVHSNRMDTATMRVDGTRLGGHAFRGQTGRMAGAFGRRRTTWRMRGGQRAVPRGDVGRGGSNCAYVSRQVL